MRRISNTARVFLVAGLSCLTACSGQIFESLAGGGADEDDPGSRSAVGTTSPISSCDKSAPEPIEPRVWALTPTQIANTLVRVFGKDYDAALTLSLGTFDSHEGFSNDASVLSMGTEVVSALFALGETIAEDVSADWSRLDACLPGQLSSNDCVRKAMQSLAQKLYRRPPDAALMSSIMAFFETAATNGRSQALKDTIQGMLLSPLFVFRTELGSGSMDDYELASSLSYFLTDGPPDTELMAAAAAGELQSSEQIEMHARRLLLDTSSMGGIMKFFGEFFHFERTGELVKDPESFKTWNESLGDSLTEESVRFVKYVLLEDDASLSTLLTADYSIVDANVAKHYGIADVPSGFEKRTLPEERRGILTHGSVMAHLAGSDHTSIVHRGIAVRKKLLWWVPPPAPEGVDVTPVVASADATQREELFLHSESEACSPCHNLMDPVGFMFENYDAIGKFRTTENGNSIDSTGGLVGTTMDGDFGNAAEFVQHLAVHPEVRDSFVAHLYQYAFGTNRDQTTSCRLQTFAIEFQQDDNMLDLIVAMVSSDHYRDR